MNSQRPSPSPHLPAASARGAVAANHVVAGDRLYLQGKFNDALACFQQALTFQPDVPDYHFRVASAAWRLDLKPMVEAHYLHAIRLDRGFAEAHKMLAQWFISQGHADRAMYHSEQALALASGDSDTIITRAVVLMAHAQTQTASDLLKPLVEAGTPSFHLASAFADLAFKTGQQAEAVALIERTLREVKMSPVLARRLHVSAASLLEATGRYDDAFSQMLAAKQLSPDVFEPAGYSRWVDANLAYFTPARMKSLPHAMHGNTRPLLIVGMPRSGTSLVEQILASHPSIFGGGELRTLGEIAGSLASAAWTTGSAYPSCLDLLSQRETDGLAAKYLTAIESLNASAIHVTDKMPQNFEWLGLAELFLPGCRVIHCQRDPRDTCLSCFLTDFHAGNAFSNNIDHLASYYRDYQRLMRHWKGVLSLPILNVQYEEVVANPDIQIRRMLDFLNLPWDERCLAFHENTRTVTTASRDQVRKPMYASSIGRWKKYQNNIPQLLELVTD